MTGKGKEIRIYVCHIHSHMCHALRTIDDGYSTNAMRFPDDCFDIIFETQYIRYLRHSDNLRLVRNLRLDIFL